MTPDSFRVRVGFVTVLLALPLSGIVARAAWLQVGARAQMRDLAEEQYLHDITLTGPRGNMLDRSNRPLAVSLKVPSVFAEPRNVEDAAAAADALAPVLKLKKADLHKKLSSGRAFYWLARRVTPEMAARVKALKLPGVGITDESRRFYPNREMAAHVLGYTNTDGEGLEGLERVFEERLAGRRVQVDGVRDARGGRLMLGELARVEHMVGDALHLTLDSQVQFLAEQALARGVLQHEANAGFVIVMEPSTGAVLALANHPTFNANDMLKASPESRRNRAIGDAFEPGSTMKALLMATAYEHKVTRPDELIDCENGVFAVGRHRIRDTHKAELLTAEDVLAHSSNIGSLKIGMRLGRQRWGDAIKAFGLGRRTELGLMGETPGIMQPPERWSEAALATISFGQGISVSGIQMATAVAAIANGGVLMAPRIVERIVGSDGREEVRGPRELGRVVSERSAALVMRAMEKVPTPDGTAPLAAVPGVVVAGKTGTAQKVDPGTRGYGRGRIASFIGVAPSKNPRLLIYVVIDEPKDSPYGGVVAAPVFREIAMGALPLMGVSVGEAPEAQADAAAQKAAPAREDAALLANGDGIDDETPDAPAEGMVPDFAGMNARAAIREALRLGLDPVVTGSGLVVAQKPRAGVPLARERTVKLTLAAGRDG